MDKGLPFSPSPLLLFTFPGPLAQLCFDFGRSLFWFYITVDEQIC
ncbi:hypothetical protein [Geobacillus icigianus]|nr:hypothetical protein [Geobacillus icigianus]